MMKEVDVKSLQVNPFTLSHFAPEQKKALGYLGSHSGRNGDKIEKSGLTPVFADGTIYFARQIWCLSVADYISRLF